jgi:hypothetical protein
LFPSKFVLTFPLFHLKNEIACRSQSQAPGLNEDLGKMNRPERMGMGRGTMSFIFSQDKIPHGR